MIRVIRYHYLPDTIRLFAIAVLIGFFVNSSHGKAVTPKTTKTTTSYQSTPSSASETDKTGECTTQACKKSSTNFLQSIDKAADPCDDFYNYACGRWAEQHPLQKAAFSRDWFDERWDDLLHDIKGHLELKDSNSASAAVNKTRNLYHSCLNADKEKLPEEMFKSVGLSLQPPAKDSKLDWVQIAINAKLSLGEDILFKVSLSPDPHNGRIARISIQNPRAGSSFLSIKDTGRQMEKWLEVLMSKEDEDKSVLKNADPLGYAQHVEHLKSTKNENKKKKETTPDITKEDRASMEKLRKQITQLFKDRADAERELEVYTLGKLQNLTDSFSASGKRIIDWHQYFHLMLENLKTGQQNLKNDDIILVSDLKYFEGLVKILEKTSSYTIKIFLWDTLKTNFIPNRSKDQKSLSHVAIEALLSTPSKTEDRAISCSAVVTSHMDMAVSHLLFDKDTLNSTKNRVGEMVSNIRSAFKGLTKNLEWMDGKTVKATLEKMEAMKSQVGAPQWVADPVQLDKYYSELEVSKDKLAENLKSLNWLKFKKEWDLRDTEFDFERAFLINPSIVNAGYSPMMNAISIPMGILGYPFYNLGLEALNYGAIGAVLGHEITHGFDNLGRLYNKYGDEVQWWTKKSIEEYNKRAQCFINQYSSYHFPELKETVNGTLTLGENIADNGGLHEALLAYREYVGKHGKERTLSGLQNFTHEQLFFLSFANVWCDSTSPKALKITLRDVHSPGRFRVIGALSNMPEFAAAWNCPNGAKMNQPKKRCKLW